MIGSKFNSGFKDCLTAKNNELQVHNIDMDGKCRKCGKQVIIIKQSKCNHNPMNKKLGGMAWQEWADKKTNQGNIQRQCPECKKWFFKCEM